MADPFVVPDAYARLYRAGRFDYWGAPYRSLTNEQRHALVKPRQLLVLWWEGIEWERDSSPEVIAQFKGDAQFRPGLIPFAGNGFGDHYCWYPLWQNGADVPVVFFVHDQRDSFLFARNFEECLVRFFLKHYATVESDDESHKAAMWKAHLAILGEVLPAERVASLVRLGGVPEACATAEQRTAAEVGDRKLIGALQPTRYREDFIKDKKTLLRLYDQSIAFYENWSSPKGARSFRSRSRRRVRIAIGWRPGSESRSRASTLRRLSNRTTRTDPERTQDRSCSTSLFSLERINALEARALLNRVSRIDDRQRRARSSSIEHFTVQSVRITLPLI